MGDEADAARIMLVARIIKRLEPAELPAALVFASFGWKPSSQLDRFVLYVVRNHIDTDGVSKCVIVSPPLGPHVEVRDPAYTEMVTTIPQVYSFCESLIDKALTRFRKAKSRRGTMFSAYSHQASDRQALCAPQPAPEFSCHSRKASSPSGQRPASPALVSETLRTAFDRFRVASACLIGQHCCPNYV
ncbi:hypothetical protein VXQ18_05650 [Brucella abortus]|nr:hypothetical protein [Brucella abortus]